MEKNGRKQKIAAVALVRDEEGNILMGKRIDPENAEAHDKWELPGGEIEFGETPEQAVVRECQEEIACTIEIVRFLPTVFSKVWRSNSKDAQVFVLCFEAKIKEGTPQPAESEISELRWFTKQEVLELDALPGTDAFVDLLE